MLDRYLLAIRRWPEQAGSTWAATPNADERAIHFSALHNVRAALDWCFGAVGDAGTGIALAAAAAPIFLAMSLLIEGRRWSERRCKPHNGERCAAGTTNTNVRC
ncbi:hypothetical protein [Bradyrhizobium sp. CCBAU 51765]|uniref:hypothetical protein n=1 Tax=Bradyrhizobium sp. CCBAU 51765 TaxID=1325102 RepID=UPI001889A71E|nr:hypothetical protein [Bradyrhizobium sp. CCBAU 51765]